MTSPCQGLFAAGAGAGGSGDKALGTRLKLFSFCSTPKAKGAGAIVFSVRLSRSRTKRLVEIARHHFNSEGPVRSAYAIVSIVGLLRTKYLTAKVVSHVADLSQRLLSKQAGKNNFNLFNFLWFSHDEAWNLYHFKYNLTLLILIFPPHLPEIIFRINSHILIDYIENDKSSGYTPYYKSACPK